jgi:hypothetical protein
MSRTYGRTLTTTAAITTALVIPVGSAQAEPAGCVPGLSDPGEVALAEYLDAPRHVAGLADGAYTSEQLVRRFDAIDADEDGLVCIKAVSNLRGESAKNWGFFYLAGDA